MRVTDYRYGLPLERKDETGGNKSAAEQSAEVKAAIESFGKAFEEFKKKNDERLKQIEEKGAADVVTSQEVDKINDALSDMQKHIDEVAKKAARKPLFEAETKESEVKAVKEFAGWIKTDDMEEAKTGLVEYRQAFDQYLRKGGRDGSNLKESERKALSAGSNPDGGYLIEPARATEMIEKIFETSDVRRYASSITIGTNTYEIPIDRDEASTGWVGEVTTRSETATPQLGEMTIKVHEQYAEPRATQNMLDDALINVEAWLAEKVSDKMARTENNAFINGDGVASPRGFLTKSVATTADDTRPFGTLQYLFTGSSGAFDGTDPGDKLIDMVYALKAGYRAGANWAMNRSVAGAIRKMQDGQGNYLWEPSFQALQPARLLGFPVAEWEDMPDLGADSLSVAFGNFRRGYLIVDRQGIRVLRDPFTAKPYVKFYSTKRVGGDVTDSDAIKLLKFGTS